MKTSTITSLFFEYKESQLSHRYVTNNHIRSLLKKLNTNFKVEVIGQSVLKEDIYGVKLGHGKKRILMWSQMHGNESTTTKAIFDLFNTFSSGNSEINTILKNCTLYIIPILNPDGAKAYTRVNANKVDLNRDAQLRSQPESKVLRSVFETFKPHFCFNLHGQRTIFSAGNTNNIATVSFLSPAQDQQCTITSNRKIAMEIIGVMNHKLQELIPKQVGVYDDAFNLNCVGDTFQSENVPTILFEAGHSPNDYGRDITRLYIYTSFIVSLLYIAKNTVKGEQYEAYLEIPENGKCFYDIIIRNAKVNGYPNDIAILYKEILVGNEVTFLPIIEEIDDLMGFYGHIEINAQGNDVLGADSKMLKIGSAHEFIFIKKIKKSLLVK
ncbi:peptidase M14 [Pseudalgibacter alginicilyticus]|uniref:Peptidase M14 n=1 Tax=Pseudalgibacter alginicilyticus TaxID=1736674 RepID=A0A0P0CDN3_9FLAO|nr:M14 family zinc carboxypeptidase [Pseudalgibacter alginicilyticus]ALJ04050.1 peptidase M14 [Pseudalgibacter alginicilyticus]